MIVLFLTLLMPFMACNDGSRERSNLTKEPLQEEMSFSYQQTALHKERNRTMEKTINIRFVKKDNGMFDCIKTNIDESGAREMDPLEVDGFFKYNKIMDTLAGGAPLWRDPRILASGSSGRLKIVEDTYNGKEVYACLQSERHTQYYEKTTGFLEGYIHETDKVKETLARIK